MEHWWDHAVGYEVYIRSFADGNGDGSGDLPGLLSRLDHIAWLGVDFVWITPFYPSPMKDWGYDVADYVGVHPDFGTLADFDAVVERANALGLRVLVDIVPNHTSDQHRWFQEALRDPAGPYRDYYIWSDPAADGGPPNNWVGCFGGRAWTLDEASGQYYCHLFLPEQPDLNWRNPRVRDEFDSILRFWLDRGVDGFRIDVAHALVKDEQLRSNPQIGSWDESMGRREQWAAFSHDYDVLQPESIEVFRRWHAITAEYGALLLGETYVLSDFDRLDRLVGDGTAIDVGFWFGAMTMEWNAESIRSTFEVPLDSISSGIGWAQDSHDEHRSVTRLGGGDVGRRRSLALATMIAGLPGLPVLYQGQELCLEDGALAAEFKLDPVGDDDPSTGRDVARTPMPWSPGPGLGFTTASETWLPLGDRVETDTVEFQRGQPGSWLHRHRELLGIRKSLARISHVPLEWLATTDGVVAFRRGDVVVAVNATDELRPFPAEGEVLYRTTSSEASVLGPDEAVMFVARE